MIKLSNQKISEHGDITIPKMIYISIKFNNNFNEKNLINSINNYCDSCKEVYPEYNFKESSDKIAYKFDGLKKGYHRYNIYFYDEKNYYLSFRKKPDGTEYRRSDTKKISYEELEEIFSHLEENNWMYLTKTFHLHKPIDIYKNLRKYYDKELVMDLDFIEAFEDARLIKEYGLEKAIELNKDWRTEQYDTEELLGLVEKEKYRLPSLKKYLSDLVGYSILLETCKLPMTEDNSSEIYKAFYNFPSDAFDNENKLLSQIRKQWYFLSNEEYPRFDTKSKVTENMKGEKMKKLYMFFPSGKYIPYVIKKLFPELSISYDKKEANVDFRNNKTTKISFEAKLIIETKSPKIITS